MYRERTWSHSDFDLDKANRYRFLPDSENPNTDYAWELDAYHWELEIRSHRFLGFGTFIDTADLEYSYVQSNDASCHAFVAQNVVDGLFELWEDAGTLSFVWKGTPLEGESKTRGLWKVTAK